mgnify:CR=1 FL=1
MSYLGFFRKPSSSSIAQLPAHVHGCHGRIQIADTHHGTLCGVGESQLLVIVGMDADLFAVLLRSSQIAFCQLAYLKRIQRAVAVHQIDDLHAALAQHLQRLVQLRLLRLGNCMMFTVVW